MVYRGSEIENTGSVIFSALHSGHLLGLLCRSLFLNTNPQLLHWLGSISSFGLTLFAMCSRSIRMSLASAWKNSASSLTVIACFDSKSMMSLRRVIGTIYPKYPLCTALSLLLVFY